MPHRVGELVQLDGSHHDWFESRRVVVAPEVAYAGWAVLMVMIDDATGRVFARFDENESWHSASDVFVAYVARYGLPRGLHVDLGEAARRCLVASPLLRSPIPPSSYYLITTGHF
ncbi:MAG: hypothetical protein ABI614_02210 [Planctomycetota bacterium]